MTAQMRHVQALAGLDPASRYRVRVFAVKLFIAVLFAIALSMSRGSPLLKSMAFLCGWQGVFSAAIALFQHQRPDAAELTGWDESVAFLGVASLMRLASALVG
jgi:hypothetical protein